MTNHETRMVGILSAKGSFANYRSFAPHFGQYSALANHRPLLMVRPQLEHTLIIRRFRNVINKIAGTKIAITRKSGIIKNVKIAKSALDPTMKIGNDRFFRAIFLSK